MLELFLINLFVKGNQGATRGFKTLPELELGVRKVKGVLAYLLSVDYRSIIAGNLRDTPAISTKLRSATITKVMAMFARLFRKARDHDCHLGLGAATLTCAGVPSITEPELTAKGYF